MKTTENTVLITGGSAGIGFEIAKLESTPISSLTFK